MEGQGKTYMMATMVAQAPPMLWPVIWREYPGWLAHASNRGFLRVSKSHNEAR